MAINFTWDTLVQNQSIAPNRFQLLQILLVSLGWYVAQPEIDSNIAISSKIFIIQ